VGNRSPELPFSDSLILFSFAFARRSLRTSAAIKIRKKTIAATTAVSIFKARLNPPLEAVRLEDDVSGEVGLPVWFCFGDNVRVWKGSLKTENLQLT